MNTANYYCTRTNKDTAGKIVSCVLKTKDGRNVVVKEREDLIKDLTNKRISVINLEYTNGKLRMININNTDAGKKAQSLIKSILSKVGMNLENKSCGDIKFKITQESVSIRDGLLARSQVHFTNMKNGKSYSVLLVMNVMGEYFIIDSYIGRYEESYSKKVDVEKSIYKIAKVILLN